MRLTMLGTGNAMVTECYNTCFVIKDEDKNFFEELIEKEWFKYAAVGTTGVVAIGAVTGIVVSAKKRKKKNDEKDNGES